MYGMTKYKKVIYNITILFWATLIVLIFKPGYAGVNHILGIVYDYGRYFVILVNCFLSFCYFRCFFQNKELRLLVFIKLYILILSVAFHTVYLDSLYSFLFVFSECIIITYLFNRDIKIALESLQLSFEIIVYINCLSMILFPEGMYNWALSDRIFTYIGHVNSTVYYVMPLFVVTLIKHKVLMQKKFSIRTIVDIFVCFSSIILTKSATSFVVLLVFVLILIYEHKNQSIIKLKLFHIYIIVVLISISIVFFNIQNHFSYIIETLLKRSLDFTGRTRYWNATIQSISENPLLGHGAVPGELRRMGFGAHNYVLEILYEGGVILFFLYLFLFFRISELINKNKEKPVSRIIFSILSAMLVSCFTESNIGADIFYIPIIITININSIIDNKECSLAKQTQDSDGCLI